MVPRKSFAYGTMVKILVTFKNPRAKGYHVILKLEPVIRSRYFPLYFGNDCFFPKWNC